MDWGNNSNDRSKKFKKLKKINLIVLRRDGWAPLRVDLDQTVLVENLNESTLNKILENETGDEGQTPKNCECNF